MNYSMMKCKNLVSKFSVYSPIGELTITYCVSGLHAITQTEAINDSNFVPHIGQKVALKNGTATHGDPQLCIEWLSAYFNNPKNLCNITKPQICKDVMDERNSFSEKVCMTLYKRVEFGQTVTYKGLAEMVGNPGAARAVGNAMAHNPLHIIIPCHRVLKSLNHQESLWTVGNYISGPEIKQWLLQHEGQVFKKQFVMTKRQN